MAKQDELQDIIFRSIVYYNMNHECVGMELEESYEKIKNKWVQSITIKDYENVE